MSEGARYRLRATPRYVLLQLYLLPTYVLVHRKTEHYGDLVETPRTRKPRRKSKFVEDLAEDDYSATDRNVNGTANMDGTSDPFEHGSNERESNVSATFNESLQASTKKERVVIDGWEVGTDPKIDANPVLEFGGNAGVTVIMIAFPTLMYYMWVGATYYDGKFPTPREGESYAEFAAHLTDLAFNGAFPSLKAWAIYWVFFVFEMACYCLLPGIYTVGKPLAYEGGKQLTYYCSGMWSFYVTIITAFLLHLTGVFPLYTLLDEFGPIMSVAILSGILVSIIAYFSALSRGAQHRMTGYHIYDFFMGAELNPRMFGILDFKMFFEVRLPWYILLAVTCAAAARQYEQYGFVSGEVCFLIMAHYLYANACSKGEECIPPTW